MSSSTSEAIAARYQHLRTVCRRLNSELIKVLSKAVMDEGARTLGLLQGGTFVFGDENEMAVLMDYCIHDLRRRGRNAVDTYLEAHRPEQGSDEHLLLHALKRARFCMARVERVEPGVGAHIVDLFRNEAYLLADLELSRRGAPGMVLGIRLMNVGEFWMSTGAPLPAIPSVPPEALRQFPNMSGIDDMSTESQAVFHAGVIRFFLSNEVRSAAGEFERDRQPIRSTSRAGRNDPCPCGSGQKFKRCCGKHASVV